MSVDPIDTSVLGRYFPPVTPQTPAAGTAPALPAAGPIAPDVPGELNNTPGGHE